MAISLLFSPPLLHSPHLPNPNSTFPTNPPFRRYQTVRFSHTPQFPESHTCKHSPEVPLKLLRLSASVILFLGLGIASCSAASTPRLPDHITIQDDQYKEVEEKLEDDKLKAEFEAWKSKTYALSVPLSIVSLRASIPPSWVKDFIQSQGKRVRLHSQFQGRLEDIFSDLSMSLSKGNVGPKSTMAADLVSVGDSWLNYAINKAIIEPISGVENQDWFKSLSDKWKVYLRRNCAGELDPQGEIWAAPYRWGTMVIAYKKSKFQQHKLAPIEVISFEAIP